ncbi:MAG: hypothetical protein D6831_03860 [Aquificota bacterium]|nr:MAG: hypothetical protein D6831_03860 [Aquificota bacterium]
MSFDIKKPKLTGKTELDKKLISKYKSEITKKINNIVVLYQYGVIDKETAEKKIQELKQKYYSFGKKIRGRKIKAKISTVKFKIPKVKAPSAPKISAPAIKTGEIKIPVKKKRVSLRAWRSIAPTGEMLKAAEYRPRKIMFKMPVVRERL